MNPITTITTTTLFNFHEHQVRTHVDAQGNPWFIAVDVCAALDIKNSRHALSKLDADEVGVVISDTNHGKREFATVNECGLYELAFTSRKKEAKEFKRWIKQTVLPALRKDGMYVAGEEKLFADSMSIAEMDAQMIEVSAQYDQMREAKMQRLRAERLRELAEDKECRRNAFRILAGKSPRR